LPESKEISCDPTKKNPIEFRIIFAKTKEKFKGYIAGCLIYDCIQKYDNMD